MNRILYVTTEDIESLRCALAEICQLRDLGCEVRVLAGGCSDTAAALLRTRDVPFELLTADAPQGRRLGRRRDPQAEQIAAFLSANRQEPCALWIGSEQTLLRHPDLFRDFRPHVQDVLGLSEATDYQTVMKREAPYADVLLAHERHRAEYMVRMWELPKLPYVLYDKPVFHPRTRDLPGSTPETAQIIASFGGQKILLCLGEPEGLLYLAQSLRGSASGYRLAVPASCAEQIRTAAPDAIAVPALPAPLFREILSHARLCAVCSSPDTLESRYSVPAGVYEAAGFGIPILGNTVPGLISSVGVRCAGICVPFDDTDAVRKAVAELDQCYASYQSGAASLFDGTDNLPVLRQVLADLFPAGAAPAGAGPDRS